MADSESQLLLAEPAEQEQKTTPSTWALPTNLSLEKLDKVVKGFFQSGADQSLVDADAVTQSSGVYVDTIKKNLRFLVSIGILSEDSATRGSYRLTKRGAEYATYLSTDIPKAGEVLKGLFEESPFATLIAFIKVEDANLTYDKLFAQIKTIARIKEDPDGKINDPARAGINCLIAALGRAGLVLDTVAQLPATVRTTSQSAKKTEKKAKMKVEINPVEPASVPSETMASDSASIQRMEADVKSSAPFTLNINVQANDAAAIQAVTYLVKVLLGRDTASSEDISADANSAPESK